MFKFKDLVKLPELEPISPKVKREDSEPCLHFFKKSDMIISDIKTGEL